MVYRYHKHAFSAGEWDTALHARADLQGYLSACAEMKNVLVRPHGGFYNRAGLEYVAQSVDDAPCRLIPFVLDDLTAYVLVIDKYNIRILNGTEWELWPLTNSRNIAMTASSSTFTWHQVGSTNEWYLQAAAGGAPPIHSEKPGTLTVTSGSSPLDYTEGIIGSLGAANGYWAYGDDPSSTYKTIYVRTSNDNDPNNVAWEIRYQVSISNVWTDEDLPKLHWAKNENVMYIFRPSGGGTVRLEFDGVDWLSTLLFGTGLSTVDNMWGPAISPPIIKDHDDWESVVNDRYEWERYGTYNVYFCKKTGGGDPELFDVYKATNALHVDAISSSPTIPPYQSNLDPKYWTVPGWTFGSWGDLGYKTIFVYSAVDPGAKYDGYIKVRARGYEYVVTAVSTAGEESLVSQDVDGGGFAYVEWNPPVVNPGDVSHFNVYRRRRDKTHQNYAYVGSVVAPFAFSGRNEIADVAKGPPEIVDGADFQGNVAPSTGVFIDQRLVVANTPTSKNGVWGSAIGVPPELLPAVPCAR
jgi:hypothetical protein